MKRRGPLARLDDSVLGAPGTARGWYADLVLGLHPWLTPVYALAALVGVALLVAAIAQRDGGLAIIGGAWLLGGAMYLWVSKGKPPTPPSG